MQAFISLTATKAKWYFALLRNRVLGAVVEALLEVPLPSLGFVNPLKRISLARLLTESDLFYSRACGISKWDKYV
ncbi:hypothetical protein [Lysobacter sp. N42]|uniref:hypothetical protein n=1 Tax=Lysobacter sp. N42 TaxID=2545719 RepID=UPI00104FD5CD|nr:hypothetical protein [Lysobacter sp. N42]TCZ90030.1 hypothetical protein EYQ95_09410 [Lysobacter sp. N42]